MKLPGDLLRDLALGGKQIFQIAIVLLRPDVRVGARVDQLDVYVKPGTCLAYAAFQDVRHSKRISDLARVLLAAKSHDAVAADHLEVGNFRQLGQDVVLNTIGKGGVLPVVTQVFKG